MVEWLDIWVLNKDVSSSDKKWLDDHTTSVTTSVATSVATSVTDLVGLTTDENQTEFFQELIDVLKSIANITESWLERSNWTDFEALETKSSSKYIKEIKLIIDENSFLIPNIIEEIWKKQLNYFESLNRIARDDSSKIIDGLKLVLQEAIIHNETYIDVNEISQYLESFNSSSLLELTINLINYYYQILSLNTIKNIWNSWINGKKFLEENNLEEYYEKDLNKYKKDLTIKFKNTLKWELLDSSYMKKVLFQELYRMWLFWKNVLDNKEWVSILKIEIFLNNKSRIEYLVNNNILDNSFIYKLDSIISLLKQNFFWVDFWGKIEIQQFFSEEEGREILWNINLIDDNNEEEVA